MSEPLRPRPARADWWPDWAGETVVIAASGPSQRRADLDHVRGKARVIAVNRTYELAPWADVLYSGDPRFWEDYKPDFAGLMVAGCRDNGGGVRVPEGFEGVFGDVLDWLPSSAQMHNSGAQAIVYAECWGASRIVLTGMDMQGQHWHPENKTNNPYKNFKSWIAGLGILAKEMNVPVLNCSRETAVDCFPRARLEDVI